MKKASKNTQKIVIKIGTNTLYPKSTEISKEVVTKLSKEISKLRESGYQVILVTSGSIALGVKKLKLPKRPKTVLGKQMAAAVGQVILMETYEKYFSKLDIPIAQILMTRDGFAQRKYYINARETIQELLSAGALPIVNENDAVASEEIKFGDNDMLSALVADLITADRLIILTDEEGLYDKNPKKYKTAKFIEEVEEVTPRIEKMASGTGSEFSLGGMASKVQAAKLATSVGIKTHIISGEKIGKISNLLEDEKLGTTFLPKGNKYERRKGWIAHGLIPTGKVYVDQGAQRAIKNNGKSLLPPGIKKIVGNFERGSAIELFQQHSSRPFAKGISNYSKLELEKIVGKKSSDIEKILGYTYGETVIHRDDLVILN